MKFLGKVSDPKDLTTKEYVDQADDELEKSTKTNQDAIIKLTNEKLGIKDLSAFTTDEITDLWNAYIR